jgi:hypothetical protein
MRNKYYIIGCGGVGSWLVPQLTRLVGVKNIELIDGDTLELKNLDRQLFSEEDIGKNKAQALAAKYGTGFTPEYFFDGMLKPRRADYIIVCADNHAARLAALRTADNHGCTVIVAANEYHDAESYIYLPVMKGTANDPRVFYPNILTDTSDDPLRPSGCTGAAADASPQLVLANVNAANAALHLLQYYTASGLSDFPVEFRPVHHKVNLHKYSTIRHSEK